MRPAMTALVVAIAGMMFPAMAKREDDMVFTRQILVSVVRLAWNLNRGGTKKVPGARYCTQGKTPQKWAVLVEKRPNILFKHQLKRISNNLIQDNHSGHTALKSLTFDIKAAFHVHAEDVHSQVCSWCYKVHGWRIILKIAPQK